MEANNPAGMNKKRARNLLIGFAVTMALLTFFSATINNISMAAVSLAAPMRTALQKVVSGNGAFAGRDSIAVNVENAGKVAAIPVAAGDIVKAGDTLMTLDTEDLKKQLKDEQDTLKKMKNNRKKTSLGYTPQDLTQLEAAQDAAKEAYDRAQDAYDAAKAGAAAGTATPEQLEAAKQARDNAKSDYTVKKNALSHSKTLDSRQKKMNGLDISNMDVDIAAQEKKVGDLKAAVQDGGKITSPIDGRVQQISVNEGASASPGQPVMTLADTSEGLEFHADVSNEDAAVIADGAKMDIHLTGTSKNVPATLREKKDSTAQPGQQTTLVLDAAPADIAEAGAQPNQAGDVRYAQQTASYEVTVPNGAIREDSVGSFVLVAEEKNTPLGKQQVLRRVDVTVTDSDPFRSAVEGPLSQRDKVVTDSDKPVADGDRVRVAS
jgi:HlyD family secretion protein